MTKQEYSDDPSRPLLEMRQSRPGDENYRAYVGPPDQYDFMGGTQFALLLSLGLREEHTILDLGCGSLRGGRLLMSYLLPRRYFGIEPNQWLIDEGIRQEIGESLIGIKQPQFDNGDDFNMGVFGVSFDTIIAQSIFSHAGSGMMRKALESARAALKPDGQFVFTAIGAEDPNFDKLHDGMNFDGWLYPGCLRYSGEDIVRLCNEAELHVQRLPWFHPRQTWYRAVVSEGNLIDDMDNAFRNGRLLFDERFPDTTGQQS